MTVHRKHADAARPATSSHRPNSYAELVESSPQGIFYCHRWWLDAVCPGQYEILTVEDGGRLHAAWPVMWRKRFGVRFITMPPLTQKLGILFAPSDSKYAERISREHKLTEKLIGKLASGTRIGGHHFHESFDSSLPFHWAGCRQTTRYTYVLRNLIGHSELWQGLRTKVRNDIRKARKAGVRIRETHDPSEFYRIQTMTYSRQSRRNPVATDLVERLHVACKANIGVRVTVAEDPQGRCHAALFAPYDRRCMAVLMSGGDPDLRNSGAGALLHWDAIEFASTCCQRLDFEGSMVKFIEQFYRGFGATLTPYSRVSGVLRNRNVGRLRRNVGELLRRMGDGIG
jgi:GNAT acetyltransferase-like protein